MPRKTRHKLRDLVPHPRFGSTVRPSGYDVSPEVIRDSYWGYSMQPVFPESVIPANISKQSSSAFPRAYYVDVLKECRDCDRGFLFFAEEQKYWYEELGFHVDADCVRCPECRKAERTTRERFQRYSECIGIEGLSDDSLATLIDDAVFLWEHNMLKNKQNLRRLKKLANKQIPNRSITLVVNKLVGSWSLKERHDNALHSAEKPASRHSRR